MMIISEEEVEIEIVMMIISEEEEEEGEGVELEIGTDIIEIIRKIYLFKNKIFLLTKKINII